MSAAERYPIRNADEYIALLRNPDARLGTADRWMIAALWEQDRRKLEEADRAVAALLAMATSIRATLIAVGSSESALFDHLTKGGDERPSA